MTIEELITDVDKEARTLRRLRELINSENFKDIYKSGSPETKSRIRTLIQQKDETRLKTLLHLERSNRDYENWPASDLRSLAGSLGIPYYSRHSKDDLILEIRRYELELKRIYPTNAENCRVGGLGYKPPGETLRSIK